MLVLIQTDNLNGNATSNPTEQKAMKLMSNTAIIKLEHTINTIDKVYNKLSKEYKNFFELNYIKKSGIVKTCAETNISEKTYYRWKNNIVYEIAREFGFI